MAAAEGLDFVDSFDSAANYSVTVAVVYWSIERFGCLVYQQYCLLIDDLPGYLLEHMAVAMIDAVVVVVDGCYSLLMQFAAVVDYCCLTISVNSVSAVVIEIEIEIETAVDYYFAPPPPLLYYK